MQLLLGFLLGVLASGIAALVYEYGMRPKLEILVDESLRAKGQKPGQSPHEFHHLKVRNIRSNYPLPGRRPAWSCKVTMEVFDLRGSRVISDTIVGRWIYQPEPLIPVLHEDQVANLLDPARLVAAQKVYIHSHEDQVFSVTIKYDGRSECHIFSNESYLFSGWQNPSWILQEGEYRLKVTLYYERGREVKNFKLINLGMSRSDVRLEPW